MTRLRCSCGAFLSREPVIRSREYPSAYTYLFDTEGNETGFHVTATETETVVQWECSRCGLTYEGRDNVDADDGSDSPNDYWGRSVY